MIITTVYTYTCVRFLHDVLIISDYYEKYKNKTNKKKLPGRYVGLDEND